KTPRQAPPATEGHNPTGARLGKKDTFNTPHTTHTHSPTILTTTHTQ
ncbi:hypothetical protein LCGC14_1079300, partial [marine sediment metagenome]